VNSRPIPVKALRTFDAVARHTSFSAAAEELHLTQSAISQQIRSLEEVLGVALFARLTRRIELTKAGEILANATHEALAKIDRATFEIRGEAPHQSFCIGTLPSFASRWLAKRISRFCEELPGLDVSVYPVEEPREMERCRADIALLYGDGMWVGHLSEELFREYLFPVCSPRLIEGRTPKRARDVLAFKLLREADPRHDYWPAWLAAAGVSQAKAAVGPKFDNLSDVITLALEGQGIALLRSALVSDELESGHLVRLFALKFQSPHSYFLVWPLKPRKPETVALFRQWLIAELRSTPGILPPYTGRRRRGDS
jgi:LysR family transcriptional regulator, glycine cleavage system transcriptional activator